MRYPTRLIAAAAAAALALLAGCDAGPASGSGAKIVDGDTSAADTERAGDGEAALGHP